MSQEKENIEQMSASNSNNNNSDDKENEDTKLYIPEVSADVR